MIFRKKDFNIRIFVFYFNFLIIVIVSILRTLDIYFTYRGIDEGWFIEGNPLYSPFINNSLFIFLVFIIATIILILINISLHKMYYKLNFANSFLLVFLTIIQSQLIIIHLYFRHMNMGEPFILSEYNITLEYSRFLFGYYSSFILLGILIFSVLFLVFYNLIEHFRERGTIKVRS